MTKICSYALIVSIFYAAYAYTVRNTLPDSKTMVKELSLNPVQRPTEEAPFIHRHMGKEFWVTPLARYDIAGLVVSSNDITSFGDIYHDETSEDVRDLCLIWGDNLDDNIHHEMKFWSESVSCHIKTKTERAAELFNGEALSNNHLLPASQEIRKKIDSVSIGDQVALSGFLVSYAPRESPEAKRVSSLERTDTGGGACEVLYVNEMTILKRSKLPYAGRWRFARTLAIALFILRLGIFIAVPLLEYRRIKKAGEWTVQ